MFITESVMTRDVKIKVGWFSSEHRWKRKNLWISAENDWISMRARPGKLFYRQGPPLTPLLFRFNIVENVKPKTKRNYQKSIFLTSRIKNSWSIKKTFRRRVPKLSEQIFRESVVKPMGLESGPERGGNASFSEHVMTKQDHNKVWAC